jgi:hypothetical protein
MKTKKIQIFTIERRKPSSTATAAVQVKIIAMENMNSTRCSSLEE